MNPLYFKDDTYDKRNSEAESISFDLAKISLYDSDAHVVRSALCRLPFIINVNNNHVRVPPVGAAAAYRTPIMDGWRRLLKSGFQQATNDRALSFVDTVWSGF